MIEPVELKDFLTVFFASAGVILFGAGYAFGYAWAELRNSPKLRRYAYLSYALLLFCVAALSSAAHFQGAWLLLSFIMAAGYFWAPRILMQLCIKTHMPHSSRPDH